MPEIKLCHGQDSTSEFTLNTCGATVISWKVKGNEQLFLSSKAVTNGTKAIRGGIPLCFPQFGPWEGRAQHGFARTSNLWQEKDRKKDENGDVSLTMTLTNSEATEKLWPYQFSFDYTVTLTTNSLKLQADIVNNGKETFDLTFCLHTYLRVNNIADVSIKGLQSLNYVDKTQGGKRIVETNPEITVNEFVDRVYEKAPDDVHVKVSASQVVHFNKPFIGICDDIQEKGISQDVDVKNQTNLLDYVVWNPWSANCLKMADMDDDGYLRMICVEAAQVSQHVDVAPGTTWTAKHSISLLTVDANL